VYGLSVINSHLHCGAPVVLTGASLLEKRFWALFQSQEATTLSGVPYTYEILRRLRWNRMNLPSLRVLTQAGGKLNAGLVGEFAAICRDKGIRLFVMYGAAEATARMSYLPPESALDKPSSIGVPIPGGEFWIEDEAGNPITDPEEVGELFYRGANVTLGYAMSREDLARGNEREGILATGDMAKCDADGMYYIVGRKSRFVKIFGNRINLEEVEQLLRGINVDCACAGNDEKIRIYMTNASKQEEVLAYVQQLTLLHHSAFQTVVIDSIPRNQAGKIIYSELA
jgi:acyl-coenzyme A synthetase/AMP-(fatty) acid ligase